MLIFLWISSCGFSAWSGSEFKWICFPFEDPQPSPCLMTEGTGFLSLSEAEKSHHGRASYHREGCTTADCWVTELLLHPCKIMSALLWYVDTLSSILVNKLHKCFPTNCIVFILTAQQEMFNVFSFTFNICQENILKHTFFTWMLKLTGSDLPTQHLRAPCYIFWMLLPRCNKCFKCT